MGIVNNKPKSEQSSMFKFAGNTNQTQASNAPKREKSKLWLNVGKMMPIKDSNGDITETFVSLPLGIALDDASISVKSNSSELTKAKALLLDNIMQEFSTIQAGDANEYINTFDVQLRHASDDVEAVEVETSKEVSSVIGSMFARS